MQKNMKTAKCRCRPTYYRSQSWKRIGLLVHCAVS